jgi:hypothetical protein
VATHKDLRRRVYAILSALRIDPRLIDALGQLGADLKQDTQQLVQWRYGPAVYREVTPPPPRRRNSGEWRVTV